MKRRLRKATLVILFLAANFVFLPTRAQQTLTQINGWNAYVHLPASYSTSTLSYPTIIFFPGIGEVGTNANAVISNGPGAYITQGWNGNVLVDGNTVEFIVISLQPTSGYPNEIAINQKIQTIKSLYRTDPDRLYLTGLSMGGWCSTTFVSGDAYGGPYTYASQIAAVVTVEGMIPNDNQPYPALFDNFANIGGKYLGFEQKNDGRDTRTVVDRMNATVPNSAVYIQTNFGSGGHCCWNEFYGGQGVQPGIFNLSGTSQNLYQWLARQSLANNNNIPPVSNAGPDITLTLPLNTAVLNGAGSDADGTVSSYLWTQIAGPSAASMLNVNTATATINNLMQGQYQFSLKVTDNVTASTIDTVIVTVITDPATIVCNSNTPVTYLLSNTQPGEIYRPNGSMWKGGDTIKITGTNYNVIEFYNIAGDPCRPIVIMPMTTLVTPSFRFKGNCRFVKLWGGNTPYGIKINGALAISKCHHIEADNIECTGGSIGIYCKQDVDYADTMTWHPNYRMTKFTFRNIWIHDVFGEGMYIGVTQPNGYTVRSTYSGLDTIILPVRLDSVEVSNCLVERTTWDGIQLSNARNGNKIFNNIVRNYGTLNISSQQAGIILGGNCSGDVYGNSVTKGTGNGIQAFGYGIINIYNNILDSCGYDGFINSNGTEGQQTIYASDYLMPSENNTKQTINAFNNIINRPKSAGGIFITGYFNNSYPSSVYNNSFCIPNAPSNWQSIYIKAYVPGSTLSNNILSCSGVNLAPIANAGANINITLPTNSTALSGSGTDADGTIASYVWLKISGPATGTLTNANTATATASGLVQGVYSYQLTVTDNLGAIGRDTVIVIVNAAANQAPTADAGSNITITLPTNSTALNGSGTDPDGTIASYNWYLISGPAGSIITSSNAALATISNLLVGTYNYNLTVTDNNGATAMDTVTVTVNPTNNIAPTANAGNDITITLPTNSTALNGSGTDPDGTIASYVWLKISGPATGTLTNANAATATASGLVQGVYSYQLTVVDNVGAIGRDTVTVTVNPANNISPTANAGNDITITLPTNSTALNGSGTDPDGTIASYVWLKISGPSTGTLTNANAATATASGLVQGVYSYQLTVVDNVGAIGRDTVTVTVNPANNISPTANAGSNITITLPTNSTALNGSGTDPDGTIASYVWLKISGPATGTLTNANAATATASGLVQGVYSYQLTVVDNVGAIGRDTVTVTVNPANNISPTANAGSNITITLPTNSTALNGSGTDPDGTIASYVWLKISGPSTGTLTNANAATATASGLVQGVYSYQLTVVDNVGAIGRDTVTVTVNPANNISPTANAGSNITITLPTNSTALNGSGTDPDGTIASYVWLKISGPSTGTLTNANAATATASGLVQGVYSYQLTVVDNVGAIGRDTVTVTVNPANNISPTANAGNDITITLPTNSTALNGSGTDPDGTIASYVWLKISGPSTGTLTNANAATATASGLVQGVYSYQLTVVDNVGAIGRDTVTVTVNPANNISPTANAGSNITITLPTNSTALNGSGTDPDGTIASYVWLKISGPATGTLTNANAATATASGLVQGVYSYQLTVVDNVGAIGRDTVTVTVNPANNISPTANAGSNITITLPTNSTALNGSGTDPDGTIASYVWLKISGPATGTLTNANAATATASGLVQGVYSYQLTVVDNSGSVGRDTVTVTVNAAGNQAPTANAGNDINIYLPEDSVNLIGLGTSQGGFITTYYWKVISSPGQYLFTNPNALQTRLKNLEQGIYIIEFTVTDNNGVKGHDTISVTVGSSRQQITSEEVNIYPNPVNSFLTAKIISPKTDIAITLVLYDGKGAKLYKRNTKLLGNMTLETIDMSSLNKGVYFLQVNYGDKKQVVKKVIKM